ncbi:MAG: hypothetical protein EPN41_03605 [Candidimonas sp.]|nr:MAG: hypothetical protein EPN41_03605 [Candidimonas sp.]
MHFFLEMTMKESRTTRFANDTVPHRGQRTIALCALALLAASPLPGYCANPDLSPTSELPIPEYSGASQNALSVQLGSNNTSHISQNGAQLTAAIGQFGSANTASTTQTGMNDLAIATQYGNGNDAKFTQARNNDTAIANQYGNSNSIAGYQYASNASTLIGQYGNLNSAAVLQVTPSTTPLVIRQIGNGGSVAVVR